MQKPTTPTLRPASSGRAKAGEGGAGVGLQRGVVQGPQGLHGAALRAVLKPFGNGGDLERWKLDAWDAEVILGKAAEVALVRVSYGTDSGSLRTLIAELHQAASEAGLVLSDDVHSKKTPAELI